MTALLSIPVPGAILSAQDGRPGIAPGQQHQGQMDTDGILSPGERRNPSIDYDQMQREREGAGDPRVHNPYNDSAAESDRRMNLEGRGRYDWDQGDRGWNNGQAQEDDAPGAGEYDRDSSE